MCGGFVGAGQYGAGSGENVETEVAAAFDPLVVLLSKHGADEADDGGAVREDAHDVGSAAELFIEALLYPALGGASTAELVGVSG